MTNFLFYLTTFGVRINGEVTERDSNIYFSDNPAVVFRYANFPSIAAPSASCTPGRLWLSKER